jgi:hypothetical protein
MLRTSENGFALPLTIFVLATVTILLSAVMVQVQVDRRIAESSSDVVDALIVAQSGLDQYLAYYDSLAARPLDGDSLRINVTGGYADVVAHIVRRPADSLSGITFIVRSRGRVIKPTQGADPQAVRVVAEFARWQYGAMDVIGALTTVNDFRCTGSSCDGTYSLIGYDQCGVEPAVYGLRAPFGPTPSMLPPEVDPAGLEGPATATFASIAFLGIDWAAATGSAFTPDYTNLVDLNTWSTYRLSGNNTLTNVIGTGLLVVDGDLELEGTLFDWQGVVLVGGEADFKADTSRVEGAFVTGLREQTGPPVQKGKWGPAGTHIDVRYNSCNVQTAFSSLTGFAPIPGGWMDNWSSY